MKKVLVITGASRGIGLATAKRFRAEDFEIINISRSPMDPNVGKQILADLSRQNWAADCRSQIDTLTKDSDRIVLIHNASVLLKDSLSLASQDFARVLQINVVASQQLNEILLPKMIAGSSILYVGSTLSEKAVANTLTYVTSKHATLGLMRATCQDLMGTGIHTSCICPGFTDTQMLRDHLGNDESILESISGTTGFGRLAKPEEIAEALYFAAENPVLNGAVVHANLGQRES